MSTKETVLTFIQKAYPAAISGQTISEELEISRTAVWKAIQSLKEEGYAIQSKGKTGYFFAYPPIIQETIQRTLTTQQIGKEITVLPSITSTNTVAKQLADESPVDGAVLIAEEQIAARGRLGRNWSSTKGKTISLSITLTPKIPPTSAGLITQIVAAAFVLTIKDQLSVSIKWPNDIVVNGKKLCGILTEMSAELTQIHYVVVGIGINTNLLQTDLPADIQKKATSLAIELGHEVDPNSLIQTFLTHFETLYQTFLQTGSTKVFLDICREYSAVLGKEVYVLSKGEKKVAFAKSIDEDGQLLVHYQDTNEVTPLFAGEISIRGLDGYI